MLNANAASESLALELPFQPPLLPLLHFERGSMGEGESLDR